jgi:hypothetical protein
MHYPKLGYCGFLHNRLLNIRRDGAGFHPQASFRRHSLPWRSAMATNVVMTIVMAVTNADAHTDAANMNADDGGVGRARTK